MANVAEYVAQIRAAIYGEQVRESIARSIEEMNQDNIETQAHYDDTIDDVDSAISSANTAAAGAAAIRDEVQQKLDNGDFVGDVGPAGAAASITVGTVITGNPGTAAQVTNSGTSSAARFDFTIPRGATGEIENIDTATIDFPIDSTYQNIASGMTLKQLFSRIQYLFDSVIRSTNIWYGTSSTSASTSAKTVTCSGFTLSTGSVIAVKFSYAQTSTSSITLNVNSTGAKTVYGIPMSTTSNTRLDGAWEANETKVFVYDGSYWRLVDQNIITSAELTALETALGI